MTTGQHDENICNVIDLLFFSSVHFDADDFFNQYYLAKMQCLHVTSTSYSTNPYSQKVQAEMGSPADVAEFAAMEPHPRKFAAVCGEPNAHPCVLQLSGVLLCNFPCWWA